MKPLMFSIQAYFTEKDESLSMSGTVRDPMARLSVWRSNIGRKLVPNLASTVTQLDGVICVIFIYHFLGQARQENKKWGLIQGFRILEGILACYLAKQRRPIYGIRALSDPEMFTILKDDSRTVCNGLRQYYRGTCRRAGLINKDLKALKENVGDWCHKSLSGFPLSPLIDIIDQKLKSSGSLNPHRDVLSPRVIQLLNNFFNDPEWKKRLKVPLLGRPFEFQEFARLCSTIHLQETSLKNSLEAIIDETQGHTAHELCIRDVVFNIKRCEIFICWASGIFNWLLGNDRSHKSKAAKELKPQLGEIRFAAAQFAKIPPQYHTRRYKELNKVAQSTNIGPEALIEAILEYHKGVMCERGQDSMIWLEGQFIVVGEPSGGMQTIDEVALDINEGNWLDDYYMSATGMIYEQLHEDPAV